MSGLNQDELAHRWAHQLKDYGRSGPLWFEGPTIYSYNTPIATIDEKYKCVWITNQTYSMTTSSKHMPRVINAIPYRYSRIYVSNVTASFQDKVDDLCMQFYALEEKAVNVREGIHGIVDRMEYIIGCLLDLNQKIPEIPSWITDKQDRYFRKPYQYFVDPDLSLAHNQRWQNFEESSYKHTMKVFLRYKDGVIETSMGAKATLSLPRLKTLWRLVLEKRSSPIVIPPWGTGHITCEGGIVVGCHRIEYDQLKFVAKQAGVL